MRDLDNTEMVLASGGIGLGSFIASYETWRLQVWANNLANSLPNHIPAITGATPLN